MEFLVNSLTRCPGNNHYTFALTVNGQVRSLTIGREDLALEPDEILQAVLTRVRSAVKEANASTFAQARTALEGQAFKV